MSPASHADPVTELLGTGGPVIPLKNAAMIVQTDVGYRYQAGQQNSHLTITQVGQQLLYTDTGTRELRDIPGSCSRQAVPTGIAALCTILAKFDADNKMFLEIWPRLGNDRVDGGPGNDTLWPDAGQDFALCGDGTDLAYVDVADRTTKCESLAAY
jgi:hypothetical protein